jgi:3-oxoacyl-[acyl-carrier protein] reductase
VTSAHKRVALITGSSRGIGRATALRLGGMGFRVVVNYNKSEADAHKAVKAIQDAGGEAIAAHADVSKVEDVEAVFQKATEWGGGVDVLVNNAGMIKDALIMRMNDETWDAVMDLNLRAAFLCTRAALRSMVRNRWGRVINIGSVVGLMGNPGQANYAASKAGMIGFTQSVAKEVASRNVTVNYVAPGYITTDIVEDLPQQLKDKILARIPLQRFGKPEEIAGMVAYLVSGDADYVTGQVFAIDGGVSIS